MTAIGPTTNVKVFHLGFDEAEEQRPGFLCGPENGLVSWILGTNLFSGVEGQRETGTGTPICLHGPDGSGKSHLLRLLEANWRRGAGSVEAHVTTGADWCRDVAGAMKGNLSRWRESLRHVGLFILDDLDQLSNREQSQRELILLLDDFQLQGTTVILTASRHPSLLRGLMAPLASRCGGGLSIPIAAPERETRMELLRRVFRHLSWEVDEGAVDWLGETLRGTPAAVMGIVARRGLPGSVGRPKTLRQWKRSCPAGGDGTKAAGGGPYTEAEIVSAVTKHFRVTCRQLSGTSRRQGLVWARGIAIYLLRTLTATSFRGVGKAFGERDHSTIRSSFQKMRELVVHDLRAKQDVESIMARLRLGEDSR